MTIKHVTVMFTDVVGYTELSRRLGPERLAPVLADHERIVAAAATNRGGRVVKNLGDSFMLAFDSVGGALAAAEAIQTAVTERNRGVAPEAGFSVKIVVNTGDVRVADDGDLFGDPVNVCARMEKLAAGGEILLSEAAYLSVAPTTTRCEEFGTHELKGVGRPVRVFRVVRAPSLMGTVERAILFCEIAGFAPLLDRDPSAAERLVGVHDERLFGAVARNGGTVQTVIGDATLVTFEAVCDAVDAITRFLASVAGDVDRADVPPLRVRASIAWGSVVFLRGRVFGDVVGDCQELLSRAAEGRPVLSAAAWAQLPDSDRDDLDVAS